MTKLITVIMSVKDSERYLSDAINSILNQTHKEIEFIITDDGSIDNSSYLIDKFSRLDSRINFVKNEQNIGIGACINNASSFASGDYIAIMDSDDIAFENRLEEQLSIYLKKTSDNLVIGSSILAFSKVAAWQVDVPETNKQCLFDLLWGNPIPHPTLFTSSSLMKKNKHKNEFIAHDYNFIADAVINHGAHLYNLQKPLVKYRVHDNQISTQLSKRVLTENKIIGRKAYDFLDLENTSVINRFYYDRYTLEDIDQLLNEFRKIRLMMDLEGAIPRDLISIICSGATVNKSNLSKIIFNPRFSLLEKFQYIRKVIAS